MVKNGKLDSFWVAFEQNYLSDEFKELVMSMMAAEPCMRPSLVDILSHPWMNGEIADLEEVRTYLKSK